jgi:peroxiredoxin
MLADGNGDFARALGLDVDLSQFGLGTRSQRYAMVVDDGIIRYLAVENSPPEHINATAEKIMASF